MSPSGRLPHKAHGAKITASAGNMKLEFMKNHSSNRAILILESPWELDHFDANRSSVRPFIEGIGKLAGDTEVFHANFYDKKSFEKALECLCKRKFENTIVYIAAHGYKSKIAGVSITDILFEIGDRSKSSNINGVLFGSCFVGANTIEMEVYIEKSNIKWISGYASSTDWFEGTIVDCAILRGMLSMDESNYDNEEAIVASFANSIYCFDDRFVIGTDYKDKDVTLRNSLKLVVQKKGRGSRAKDVSDQIFN